MKRFSDALLLDYLDGCLDARRQGQVERAAASDPAVRQRLDRLAHEQYLLRATFDAVHMLPVPPQALRRARPPHAALLGRWWHTLELLGGAVVLLLLAALWTFTPADRPQHTSLGPASSPAELWQRPWLAPALADSAACPVSTPTAFDAQGALYGAGPVQLRFAVENSSVIFTSPVSAQRWAQGQLPKTTVMTWQATTGYTGPILLRGQQLDGAAQVAFGSTSAPHSGLFIATGTGFTSGHERGGSVDPYVDQPGCYALQIDGSDFSYAVVFAARDAAPPPAPAPAPLLPQRSDQLWLLRAPSLMLPATDLASYAVADGRSQPWAKHVVAVTQSRSGQRTFTVANTAAGAELRLWQGTETRWQHVVDLPGGALVSGLDLTADDAELLVQFFDPREPNGSVWLLRVASADGTPLGPPMRLVSLVAAPACKLVPPPSGAVLYALCSNYVYSVDLDAQTTRRLSLPGPVLGIALSPDGRYLYAPTYSNRMLIFDTAQATWQLQVLPDMPVAARAIGYDMLALSADGRRLVVGYAAYSAYNHSSSTKLYVYDTSSWTLLQTGLAPVAAAASTLVITPDAAVAYMIGVDMFSGSQSLLAFDLVQGQLIGQQPLPTIQVSRLKLMVQP